MSDLSRLQPEDSAFMRSALGLARRALGRTAPNPSVGCLVVKNGRVVGRGWTQPGGRPHAEPVALAAAGAEAAGATVYVTLEPCAHHGRTPPCTDALLAAGVARVVIPFIDPDPRVSGRGIAALRDAGVSVSIGCLEREARALNRGFLTRLSLRRPMLTLKIAQSLDGRIALADGQSRWITGPLARLDVHRARGLADAILVGSGTVRADDPMLTVRGVGAKGELLRIVVSTNLDLPATNRVAKTAHAVPTWLIHGPNAPAAQRERWEQAGAELVRVDLEASGRIDLKRALGHLGERGLNHIYCEGGANLAASLIDAGLVDRLVVYSAGLTLGASGLASLAPLDVRSLDLADRFDLLDIRSIGQDIRATWGSKTSGLAESGPQD